MVVLVLVFRDTILGFLRYGNSCGDFKKHEGRRLDRNSKYNIEGNIANIDLLTTKIIGF